MERLILLILILIIQQVKGQIAGSNLIAGADGLKDTGSTLWGKISYPASMSSGKSMVGVFGEKMFMTSLVSLDAGVATNLGSQPILIRLHREGNNYFSTMVPSVALSRKITQRLNIGARLGYSLTNAKGYGSSGIPLAGLGLFFKISQSLTWALQADGLNALITGTTRKIFSVRSGLGLKISELVFINVEILKEEISPGFLFAGFSYSFKDQFFLRLGLAPQLSQYIYGLGFSYGELKIELTSSYHLSLGLSAGFGVHYSLSGAE